MALNLCQAPDKMVHLDKKDEKCKKISAANFCKELCNPFVMWVSLCYVVEKPDDLLYHTICKKR